MFDLERFVSAQEPVYSRVLGELRNGYKTTHWMWFIFPQIAGLGFSSMAQRYAICGLAEARAYLEHPVLGPRLGDCTSLLLTIQGRSANEILGSPDDVKLRSCATLFGKASSTPGSVFEQLLGKYYQGKPDPATLKLLASQESI
jgi:uncharacterized protein (DUF1810 family)